MTNPSTSAHDDSAMPFERISTIPTELLDCYVALGRAVEIAMDYRNGVRPRTDYCSHTEAYDDMELALAAVQKAQSV